MPAQAAQFFAAVNDEVSKEHWKLFDNSLNQLLGDNPESLSNAIKKATALCNRSDLQ